MTEEKKVRDRKEEKKGVKKQEGGEKNRTDGEERVDGTNLSCRKRLVDDV